MARKKLRTIKDPSPTKRLLWWQVHAKNSLRNKKMSTKRKAEIERSRQIQAMVNKLRKQKETKGISNNDKIRIDKIIKSMAKIR